MKNKIFSFAICLAAVVAWSCNNSSDADTAAADTNARPEGDSTSLGPADNSMLTTAPLTKDDSSFVMEAAGGGMMEVQLGQLAQQQAASSRVKDFGNMMVTDHSKANDELKNYASSHGLNLPSTLPADKQKKVDELKSLKGAAFDKKYMSLMVEDHKEDVEHFQKQANSANDPQLKQWASGTVPVLQKHLDSAQAINKAVK